MAGMGSVFVAAGKKYGVDPRLGVAISGAESSFGKHLFAPFNAWGWMSDDRYNWGSWQQGINTVMKGLGSGYVSQGLTTPAAIVKKYAPSSAGNDEAVWSGNVSTFLRELGAAPSTTTSKFTVKPTPTITAPSTTTTTTTTPFQLPAPLKLTPSTAGIEQALVNNLLTTAQRGRAPSGQELLSGVTQGVLSDQRTDEANKTQVDSYNAALAKLASEQSTTTTTDTAADTANDTSTQGGQLTGSVFSGKTFKT